MGDRRFASKKKRALFREVRVRSKHYFSDELTDENMVLSWGPMAWTMPIIVSAMPQAIKQYSIAVAPD